MVTWVWWLLLVDVDINSRKWWVLLLLVVGVLHLHRVAHDQAWLRRHLLLRVHHHASVVVHGIVVGRVILHIEIIFFHFLDDLFL